MCHMPEHIAFRSFQPDTSYFHFIFLQHHVTGASKDTTTLIEGELLPNDGPAIVVFELFMEISIPGDSCFLVPFVSWAHFTLCVVEFQAC